MIIDLQSMPAVGRNLNSAIYELYSHAKYGIDQYCVFFCQKYIIEIFASLSKVKCNKYGNFSEEPCISLGKKPDFTDSILSTAEEYHTFITCHGTKNSTQLYRALLLLFILSNQLHHYLLNLLVTLMINAHIIFSFILCIAANFLRAYTPMSSRLLRSNKPLSLRPFSSFKQCMRQK